MSMTGLQEHMDWARLTGEFRAFELGDDALVSDCSAYVQSLREPCPKFVQRLIAARAGHVPHERRDACVRAMYWFLLEKRYEARMNLLHFAFLVFEDETCLPEAVIAVTPFPHEDGYPPFRLLLDEDFLSGL